MPRPSMENEVREAVRVYLVTAVAKSPEDAPLHVLAVAKQTGFDRKTLKKYGLDMEIAAAAEEQAKGSELSPREAQRRSQADALHDRDQEIATAQPYPSVRTSGDAHVALRIWIRQPGQRRSSKSI